MTNNLLLELANPVRMKILRIIAAEPGTAESIAQQVGTSVEETKVNIDRLSNFKFVEVGGDGRYRASPLGHLALTTLADMEFVSEHSDFFQDHELSLLPSNLISRLGELADSRRMDGSVSNIQRAERVIRRSEGRVWVVTNEVMLDVVPVIREKIEQGTDFRIIIDQTFKPPESFEATIPDLWRTVPKIPAMTVVTAEEAMLFFPNEKLEPDTSKAFASDDLNFMKWCEDLVNHLWNEGHKLK
jgi:predicted transcriptional regulator